MRPLEWTSAGFSACQVHWACKKPFATIPCRVTRKGNNKAIPSAIRETEYS